jgi:hypothetical protein
MSFVYEINGQRIEFEKEPTEKDIDEAARATKPAPKSARPKPVEGAGGAAFGVYPQAGRRPESQQDREAAKDMALQTARGVASNVPAVLGIPGSVVNTVANLPRTAQDIQNRYQIAKEAFTGQAPQTQPLPEYNQVTPYDMNYFGQLTPGPEPTSPAGQLAFAGGQVLGAPVMTRTIQGAARVPGQVANTARELRTGATEGLRNPTYQSNATTAFQPLKETYYPAPEVQRFQAMPEAQRPAALPALEASQQPSASLFQTPGQMLARNLGPQAAGETLIPLQGRTTRALGEQVARDISNRPLTAGGVGLGGAALGGLLGGPLGAMAGAALAPGMRFAQLAAMNKLSQTAGFAPGFTEQLAAARGRAGIQSGMPTTPALGYTPSGGGGGAPAPGPVNPATMYAGAGGVSSDLGTAGAAALNVKYPPFTPPQAVQQAAAERITPPTTDLQARAQAAFGSQYRPPAAEQAPPPVNVAPVVPESMPAPVVETPVASITTPGPVAPAAMPEPVATPPAPVVQSTMPTKTISENNVFASPNAVKIDQASASTYKTQNPNYNITYDVVSTEGQGKKAKQVVTSVNEQAVDNKKFKAQPDIIITEKITKTSSTGVNTVFKGRTANGIPIEIENLNSNSYYGPKVYAVVNGKKQLVKEFSTFGEELDYIANDKTAKRLGVDLKPTQHVAPEEIQNISARGFRPDPETPFHHEFTDPVRYTKYKTTGVDPKGVWETDQRQVQTYKEKQAKSAAKKGNKQ